MPKSAGSLAHVTFLRVRQQAAKRLPTGRQRIGYLQRKGSSPKGYRCLGPSSLEGREIPAPAPPLETGPRVQLVPPKRRIERQKLQRAVSSEMLAKAPTALSGVLPSGPIAVSAHEARKAEARSATPPVSPMESEVVLNISSERSLGTLVRAFERSCRLNSIGTS